MKNKRIYMVSALAALIMVLGLSVPIAAAPKSVEYNVIDVGPELRTWVPTVDRIAAPSEGLFDEAEGGGTGVTASGLTILDTKLWLSLDDYNGVYFFDYFYLVAESGRAQIWVQTDLSWPAGDPRDTPVITQEQVGYLLSEFDNNIYTTCSSFFGVPDFHDGTYSLLEDWGYVPEGYYGDVDGRQVILVSNIEDENYYDPDYRLYIAGFYSPTFEAYFDRNVMSIDAYQWEERVGPDGEKPYLYEGTFAHEFQHLIHDDMDADEELWVNEGCSDFAEFLCGYGHPQGHVDDFAVYAENSLVAWGDQGDEELLADYGIAYLWTLNLYEHFGGPFIQALVANPDNGISGVNSTLGTFGYDESFADIFAKWAASLITDPGAKGGGAFGFENIDFSVDFDSEPGQSYDTPGAPPWGADFIKIDEPGDVDSFIFNGVNVLELPTAWTSDGDVLWSGTGDLIDNWAIFEATGGGTLSFDTYVDIEDYWDFGFVQVSTDGGYTWTSLANAYTTSDHDPSAHPNIVANLPGLTGWSGDWMNMSFDLGAYDGQDILIAFRYMTDWATTYEGWFIDNVYVDSTLVSDGSDANVFMDITEVVPVDTDFSITLIGQIDKKNKTSYRVVPVNLDNLNEGSRQNIAKIFADSTSVVVVITYNAPEGITSYAGYDLCIDGDMYS